MNRKQLIVEVYSQPLVQELLKKKLMSKQQLVEWVLSEQDEQQPEPSDPSPEQPADTSQQQPEQPAQEEEPQQKDETVVKRLRLPLALGLNAATTILKIVKQIDNELNLKNNDDGSRTPIDSDDEDLIKIATANTNTEKRMHRHVKISAEGKLEQGDLRDASLVNFFNVINSVKDEDYSKITENPQDFETLNTALASALKDVKPTGNFGFEIKSIDGGTTFKVTSESIVDVIKFIGIINTEKKSLLERAKLILQKKGGYKSTSRISDISRELLSNTPYEVEVPEDFTPNSVYSILELLYPEGT